VVAVAGAKRGGARWAWGWERRAGCVAAAHPELSMREIAAVTSGASMRAWIEQVRIVR
jgi:hypothetical protein